MKKKQESTTIRNSSESNLQWKEFFRKNSLYFRIIGDFQIDKEIDNSSTCNKTANIYKQNPVCNGYRTESELNDVSKSGYYESALGYINVDWFEAEVIKLKKR